MVNFPTSLDTSTQLPQPSAGDFTNLPSHAGAHDAESIAIIALETKLGTGASTPIANKVLRGTGIGTTAFGSLVLTTDVTGTLPIANGGTGATASTGTGNLVLATSPTIVSPTLSSAVLTSAALGTPTSGVMTNVTGLPRVGIDWTTFSNNVKAATNTSSPTLSNADLDLASSGLSLSFTLSGTGYAMVTVCLGISSTSDYEFKPEIRLGGSIIASLTPSAAIGNASSRSNVRSVSYLATLSNGVNTLSAGVFLSSSTNPGMSIGGGTISAIVFGNVTA